MKNNVHESGYYISTFIILASNDLGIPAPHAVSRQELYLAGNYSGTILADTNLGVIKVTGGDYDDARKIFEIPISHDHTAISQDQSS